MDCLERQCWRWHCTKCWIMPWEYLSGALITEGNCERVTDCSNHFTGWRCIKSCLYLKYIFFFFLKDLAKERSYTYLGKKNIYDFLVFIHFFFGNILFWKTGYFLCNLGFTFLSNKRNESTGQPTVTQSTNLHCPHSQNFLLSF